MKHALIVLQREANALAEMLAAKEDDGKFRLQDYELLMGQRTRALKELHELRMAYETMWLMMSEAERDGLSREALRPIYNRAKRTG